MLTRIDSRLLAGPADVSPTSEDCSVVGVFNPGAVAFGDKVYLLLRVAEAAREHRPGFVALPRSGAAGRVTFDWLREDEVDVIDSRMVTVKATGRLRLTNLSHLRLAVSTDGLALNRIEPAPFLAPEGGNESFGIEDPRITVIDGRAWMTYVAVSERGIATALASTDDFQRIERRGIIFQPENKDVVLFPERVDGDYVAIHRPSGGARFGIPEMWIARSPDLIHWGRHRPLVTEEHWPDAIRLGAGAPPVRTEDGWLVIYHGVRKSQRHDGCPIYFTTGMILDLERPERVLYHGRTPLLEPELAHEREGFFPNVIFVTGCVVRDGQVYLYHGAADTVTAVVSLPLDEVVDCIKHAPKE